MTELLRDIRHSFRLIRRHPGHALAVLLTLAVAIAAGTVVIALVDEIVLRPLPFADSERVVRLQEVHDNGDKAWGASLPDLRDWAAASKSFEALALARNSSFTLDLPSGSVNIDAAIATPQWFAIHSLQPRLGRFFREEEMRKGNNHVVVLSQEMWRTRFNADPQILQRRIRLDGDTYQIIGVLPEHPWIYQFDYAKFWVPLSATRDDVEKRSWRGFIALGRLRPGVSPSAARQELSSIEQRLAKTYPESDGDLVQVDVEPLRDVIAGPIRKLLFIFAGSIALILLIACANVANLSLAFNSWRAREFSLRHAVGAWDGRITRQLLVESLVLALIGGAVGLAVAHGGLTLFRAVAPDDIPRLDEVTIDWRIALITVAVSIVSAFLFGILPARRAAHSFAASGERTTAPGTDLRRMLVVGELALAFMLVTATGLMTRAFAQLMDWKPGFRSDGVTVVWAIAKGRAQTTDAVEMFDRAALAMEAIPGVTGVAQASAGPLFGGMDAGKMRLVVGGREKVEPTQRWFDISPDYFRTLGIPLLRGRELKESDRNGTVPVAVINETMARRYWGNVDPIGAHVAIEDQPWEIVGVVGNVHPFRPDELPEPEIYMPKRQMPRLATYFVIRSALPAAALQREVTDVLAKHEPAVQLGTFHSLAEIANQKRVAPRFNVIVVSILSALAFVLAAIGIYGLVSFSVVSRAREIAIRLAVGADPKRVVREIVRDGGTMLIAGLLIGLIAAVALARVLSTFLFGLSPFDLPTWLGAGTVFAAVVLVACWVPARRAAAIDPAAQLRVE